MPEFQSWPKTPRLFRECVITEKIDGTNAAIGIRPDADGGVTVYAQSRNRIITPESDNYGFATWVNQNADSLVKDLGYGLHFGEWWGKGIQRNYGMETRQFSLFNVGKWLDTTFETPNLGVVPLLATTTFNTEIAIEVLYQLRVGGSYAAPGFMSPEGICVYHTASKQVFKALLENDDVPKSSLAVVA